MKPTHYTTLAAISLASIGIGYLLPQRSEPIATVSPAATAILSTLAPSALADLHLAEFLAGQRTDYSEGESSLATPAILKAARLKGFAKPE
jgi:hypothetical protein